MLKKISFPQSLEQWKTLPQPKERKVYPLWIKKLISFKDWIFFKDNSSYCFLKKEKEGVLAGFLVANPELENGRLLFSTGIFPKDCSSLTDEEALQVDQQRRGCNVRPFACELCKP